MSNTDTDKNAEIKIRLLALERKCCKKHANKMVYVYRPTKRKTLCKDAAKKNSMN